MFTHTPSNIALAFIQLEGIVNDMEVGVLPSEQGRKQRLTIDVTVGFPDKMTQIGDSEEELVNKGLDTRLIREAIRDSCNEKTQLLETIANRACANLFSIPGILTVQLKITKTYAWADTEKTSLTISRAR